MNKKNIIKKAAINADLTVKEEQKAVEAFLCAVSDILKEDRNEAHTLQAFRKHHALYAQVWTLILKRQ